MLKKYSGINFIKSFKTPCITLDAPQNSPCYLENIRMTENGVILKNNSIISNSITHNKSLNCYRRIGFLIKYIFPSFPFAKKDEIYIKINDEWSDNYYHWVIEALSNLIKLRKLYPKSIIVLPKKYLKKEYVIKSLEAFQERPKDVITIARRSNLKLPKLSFIPRQKENERGIFDYKKYYDSLQLSEIRNQIISHFKGDLNLDLGEKIYISRNNPKCNFRRKISNENEVKNCLEKHGFKTVYMEDYKFIDQISIALHAKYIVAAHGAGITNVLFIKQDGCLLELTSKEWSGMFFIECFKEILTRIKIKYFNQNCKILDQNNGDIEVDIAKLEENLSKII